MSDSLLPRPMVRWPCCVSLVLCLLAVSVDGRAAVTFGVRTQIWPFLFADQAGVRRSLSADEQMKQAVALGNLDRYVAIGATWNIVDVWQDIDGPDGLKRLERVVAEHDRRGIQVALRLLERPEMYDDIAAGGAARRRALAAYRTWVRLIATRFGTRIRYYMISNEVDHDVGFNRPVYRKFRPVTVAEYGTLLQAAYASIKGVDARLRVADQAVSAYSLALAVMADMAVAGDPGGSLAFWRAMSYAPPEVPERSAARLIAMLANSESRRRIEFARRSTSQLGQYRDVYQLHHYHGPRILPSVLAWVRNQLGPAMAHQPILAAEVGYHVPVKPGRSWDGRPINVADLARYSEGDHAISVVKTLTTLAGSGIEDMLYWQMRFHVARDPVASLYPASELRDDFRPGLPVRAYSFVAGQLAGAHPVAGTPELRRAGLIEYRFRRETDVSVAWADAADPVALPAGLRSRVGRLTDSFGKPMAVTLWDGHVGAEPVVIFWRPE